MVLRFVDDRFCTGCGTCAGVCKADAITMKETEKGIYSPLLDLEKCTRCGMCKKACHRNSSDLTKVREYVFKSERGDLFLGNYFGCYLGFAVDTAIRWKASSGGLVTSILRFLLEEGVIDGALVVRMSAEDPLRPEVILARTQEEILSGIGSKYCPTSVNVMLKRLIAEKGRFAVVGLPCHLQGMRKAEILDDRLRKKIALHLGLFCAHTVDFRGTEFLLRKLGVRNNDVSSIDYRGGGWPGNLNVKTKNGGGCSIPYHQYYVFKYFLFTPFACTVCYDGTAELADISFGDPWLPELRKEKAGKSVIVTRTKAGERILQDAYAKGRIIIETIDKRTVLASQKEQMFFKKRVAAEYSRILQSLGRKAAPRTTQNPSRDFLACVGAVIPFMGTMMTSWSVSLAMLDCAPLSMMSSCNRILSIIGKTLLRNRHITGQGTA